MTQRVPVGDGQINPSGDSLPLDIQGERDREQEKRAKDRERERARETERKIEREGERDIERERERERERKTAKENTREAKGASPPLVKVQKTFKPQACDIGEVPALQPYPYI